ncbi:MAG TPA: aspartate carbamoyltransferase, partial [Flavobacteriales bacterium]|nr:aspartate carbamoyltransferase [Flavobacteriales bacterium]
VCGPPTLIPKYIKSLGIEIGYNLKEAIEWCDVAMMLRIQLERQGKGDGHHVAYFPSLREYTMQYGLTLKMLDKLKKEITIMHPGPINRGIEISTDVADSGHSIILNQVENGVAVRMAVLYLLAGITD